jgi:tetratricopeptide (TPR) repeat protein
MVEGGYIYIAINESYKGLVKIGRSSRPPEARAKELSRPTGVPTRFHVAYQEFVADCHLAEKLVHKRLEQHRVNQRREFFNVPLKEAIKIVSEVADEIGTGTGESLPSPEVIVYSLVQRALALHTQGRLEEAKNVASDAMQVWLDKVGGYNLYLPASEGLVDEIDAVHDEIIRRFRQTFLSEAIESTQPELAARIRYFPCVIPLDIREPAARLEYLLEAQRVLGHYTVNQMISDCYSDMGDEINRVDYFLRYAFEECRSVGEDNISCLAYVYEHHEKLKSLRERLVEAKGIHRLLLDRFTAVSNVEDLQGLIKMFYELYWQQMLAFYKLDDELSEAYRVVFGEAVTEEGLLWAQANAFWERKLYDDAEMLYHRLVDKYGEDDTTYYYLARVCEDKGDLAGAVEFAQKATSLNPQDEYLVQELSRIQKKLNPQDEVNAAPTK